MPDPMRIVGELLVAASQLMISIAGPLPDLDDSFISPVEAPPAPQATAPNIQVIIPTSNATPSFPTPQFTINPGGIPGLTSRSISLAGPPPSSPAQLTRPANDPLPPLTDKEKNAFMAIFDRNEPQGGVISGQSLPNIVRSFY